MTIPPLNQYQVALLTNPGNYSLGGEEALRLYIGPGGKRSYHIRYKLDGQKQRVSVTLGTTDELTLGQARSKARETIAKLQSGELVVPVKPRSPRGQPTERKSQAKADTPVKAPKQAKKPKEAKSHTNVFEAVNVNTAKDVGKSVALMKGGKLIGVAYVSVTLPSIVPTQHGVTAEDVLAALQAQAVHGRLFLD